MGIDLWVFRDSNWSPDFPMAAYQASQLYEQTRNVHLDGVIAVNQNVVGALVDGFSPLTIDGQTINTAAEMRAYMHAAWAPSTQTSATEWLAQRKNFMGRVMQTLLERMMNGDGQVNWSTLGQALDRTLHSRDLLITFADPVLNAPLHAARLDGALLPSEGDYVMVVDTSMGFNKVSSVMQQAIHYSVTLSTDSAPQAHADLGVYQHQSAASRVRASTARLQFGHHLSAVDSTMLLALSAGADPGGRRIHRGVTPSHRAGRIEHRAVERWRDPCQRRRRQDRVRHVFDCAARTTGGEQPQLHAARFDRSGR